MIYCVELAFVLPAREAEWNAWYSQHLGVLLSVPGFLTAQRLQSVAPNVALLRAPYLAAYSVASADVFDSAPYRQRGGRGAPGEWAPLMVNWDRNLFEGLVEMPEVKADQLLAVVDRAPDELARDAMKLSLLHCVGLDRTVQSRGIAVLSTDEYAQWAARANEHTRFYRPLTTQLRAASRRVLD